MKKNITVLLYIVIFLFPSILLAQNQELNVPVSENVLILPKKETKIVLSTRHVNQIICPEGWTIKKIYTTKPVFETKIVENKAYIKFEDIFIKEYPHLIEKITIICANKILQNSDTYYKLIIKPFDITAQTIQLVEDTEPFKKELLRCKNTNKSLIKLIFLNVCLIIVLIFLLKRKNRWKT